MTVNVRFAPSPTGLLHVGNARLALINWLFARRHQGRFILRLDDTDAERSEERYVEAIRTDLRWLGLAWDREERQSQRRARYSAVIEALKAEGRLYPCYETPEELSLKRKSQLQQGRPPIYDRGALKLTDAQRTELEAAGRQPHWRFLLRHEPLQWQDLSAGAMRFEGADLSDPVLIREDGRPLYMLPSCVDDHDFGVSHIVRGDDHIANSAIQIQIFEALGGPVPDFAHIPLLLDASGDKLSKRIGSLSLRQLREGHGIEPMALNAMLARLGTADPVEAETALEPLIESFDFAKVSRASPRFDESELQRINARIVHQLDFEAVQPRLAAMGLDGIDRAFWEAVKPNINTLAEVQQWWAVARGPITPDIAAEDAEFLAQAADLLPPEPWDADTWAGFVERVKEATGRKGKALFMPLRKALTGRAHGPELALLLPLIGRERASSRLRGQSA